MIWDFVNDKTMKMKLTSKNHVHFFSGSATQPWGRRGGSRWRQCQPSLSWWFSFLIQEQHVVITKFVMISYIGSKYFAETTLVSFLSSSKFSIFMFFSGVREWSQAGYQPMIYPMMMMVPCPQVKVILLALIKKNLCQIYCVKLALPLFHWLVYENDDYIHLMK